MSDGKLQFAFIKMCKINCSDVQKMGVLYKMSVQKQFWNHFYNVCFILTVILKTTWRANDIFDNESSSQPPPDGWVKTPALYLKSCCFILKWLSDKTKVKKCFGPVKSRTDVLESRGAKNKLILMENQPSLYPESGLWEFESQSFLWTSSFKLCFLTVRCKKNDLLHKNRNI